MSNLHLLGGATRVRTRPRGFADWRPSADSVALIDQVKEVLLEYASYLPLTCRQIFYRMVGKYGYEKTENASERLNSAINRARRARIIDMDDIRDDGGTLIEPHYYDSEDQFLRTYRRGAKEFRLDRQEGQKRRILIVCEAAGMAPQLAAVADSYGISVRSGGGFDSTTDQHNVGKAIADYVVPTEILHIGDYDPSACTFSSRGKRT
jgi:hypothetical protein